jgi:hypothetical protein
MLEFGYRSCKCGAVYDRSEHIVEAREVGSFECAVCGATVENWNSAWVPRYKFIACPATDAKTSHIEACRTRVPQFQPEMNKGGRWFVAVKTGNGPDSHIGDFETEADAKDWISTKSKYWPGKPDAPK